MYRKHDNFRDAHPTTLDEAMRQIGHADATYLFYAGSVYYPDGQNDLRSSSHSVQALLIEFARLKGKYDWVEVVCVPHVEDAAPSNWTNALEKHIEEMK